MVTHDHEEAFTVADRLAVMRAGRIVQQGAIAEVWRAPADPETALFLGYARVLEATPAAAVRRVGGRRAARPRRRGYRRSALAVADAFGSTRRRRCAASWSSRGPRPSRSGWSSTSRASASSTPWRRSTSTRPSASAVRLAVDAHAAGRPRDRSTLGAPSLD